MSDRPLSRQPECHLCAHEEHLFFACESCPCGVHMPNGIESTPFLLHPWESA